MYFIFDSMIDGNGAEKRAGDKAGQGYFRRVSSEQRGEIPRMINEVGVTMIPAPCRMDGLAEVTKQACRCQSLSVDFFRLEYLIGSMTVHEEESVISLPTPASGAPPQRSLTSEHLENPY